jgi:hypothetical protein
MPDRLALAEGVERYVVEVLLSRARRPSTDTTAYAGTDGPSNGVEVEISNYDTALGHGRHPVRATTVTGRHRDVNTDMSVRYQ